MQVFHNNNPGKLDIIELAGFMSRSRPLLNEDLYDEEQIKNIEAFKRFAETSSAFVSFINKEQEKETQKELEKINNTMASLSENITRLGLPSEINSIFETSLTEQKKSAQLILDNPKTLSELQNTINSTSLFLEENPPLNNMPFRFDAIGMLPLDASPLAQQSGTLGQKKNKTLDRLSDAFSSGYAFEGFYIDWIQHCF